MVKSLLLACLVFLLLGCGTDKISKLEKENQELKAEATKNRAVADYDLQAKCSKDARAWFKENFPSDKDTILLNFTNHYHRGLNKCFILIEYHYNFYMGNGSWVSDLIAWDVYENSKFANFGETHVVYPKPEYHMEDKVMNCEVWDKKCTTVDEFKGLVRPYMND